VNVGRYDEVTPRVARSIHPGIRGSKLVRFEKSAHLAMWEERAMNNFIVTYIASVCRAVFS
jgi:proline iminopeptidase